MSSTDRQIDRYSTLQAVWTFRAFALISLAINSWPVTPGFYKGRRDDNTWTISYTETADQHTKKSGYTRQSKVVGLQQFKRDGHTNTLKIVWNTACKCCSKQSSTRVSTSSLVSLTIVHVIGLFCSWYMRKQGMHTPPVRLQRVVQFRRNWRSIYSTTC